MATAEFERLSDVLSITQKTEYMQISSVYPQKPPETDALAIGLTAKRQALKKLSDTLLAAANRLEGDIAADSTYFNQLTELTNKLLR